MTLKQYIVSLITSLRYNVKRDSSARLIKSSFEGGNFVGRLSEICNSRLGFGSYVAENSVIRNAHIGRFCSIGDHVRIGLGQHPTSGFVSTHPAFFRSDFSKRLSFPVTAQYMEHTYLPDSKLVVDVGSDVWICNGVTIKDGVKIGHGCILGLGAYVTRDTEPFGVYVGSPARLLKFRFSADEIEELLRIAWWSREIELIRKASPYFSNFREFLMKFEGRQDFQ